jgi:hypothetical protein
VSDVLRCSLIFFALCLAYFVVILPLITLFLIVNFLLDWVAFSTVVTFVVYFVFP